MPLVLKMAISLANEPRCCSCMFFRRLLSLLSWPIGLVAIDTLISSWSLGIYRNRQKENIMQLKLDFIFCDFISFFFLPRTFHFDFIFCENMMRFHFLPRTLSISYIGNEVRESWSYDFRMVHSRDDCGDLIGYTRIVCDNCYSKEGSFGRTFNFTCCTYH